MRRLLRELRELFRAPPPLGFYAMTLPPYLVPFAEELHRADSDIAAREREARRRYAQSLRADYQRARFMAEPWRSGQWRSGQWRPVGFAGSKPVCRWVWP